MDVRTWISHNLKLNNQIYHRVQWPLLFGVIVWQLWTARNIRIFENQRDDLDLAYKCINWAQCVQTAKERILKIFPLEAPQTRVKLTWTKPHEHTFKLNVEAAISSTGNSCVAVGILRDSLGLCRGCFQVPLGICSTLFPEVWGIWHGLKWVLEKGITNLRIESDSQLAVNYVNNPSEWQGRQRALF